MRAASQTSSLIHPNLNKVKSCKINLLLILTLRKRRNCVNRMYSSRMFKVKLIQKAEEN